jgi:hypothetical protein
VEPVTAGSSEGPQEPVRRFAWATAPFDWGSPPGWLFHGTLTVAAGCCLWSASAPPGAGLFAVLGALLVFGLAALLWTIRGVAFVARMWRDIQPPTGGWRFVIAPFGGLLLVGLILARVPLEVRWALSEASFDRAVANLEGAPSPRTVELDDRIGLYHVSERLTEGSMVIFVIDGGGLFEEGGVAWLPDGQAAFVEGNLVAGRYFEALSVNPLGDGWYVWETRVD